MSNQRWLPRDVWGRHLWGFIHTICIVDGDECILERNKEIKAILENLTGMLPCHICCRHYESLLAKYPLSDVDLSKPMSLFEWSVKIHNEFNTGSDRPEYTVDQALNQWGLQTCRHRSVNIKGASDITPEFLRKEILKECGPIDVNIVSLPNTF